MKRQILILSLFFSISVFATLDGGDVGNGGDGIFCVPSPENQLAGWYSLDYVLTLPTLSEDNALPPVNSWDDSADRLRRLFEIKAPYLLPSFTQFAEDAFNTTNYTKKAVWEPSPFGLIDLKDESNVSLIPENCMVNGKIKISQVVIRQKPKYSGSELVIYKYVPELVESLNANSPLQLSFLMVHEWLWEISDNVDRNRRLNRFLHSREFSNQTPDEARESLKNIGLDIEGLERKNNVYSPDSCNGDPLSHSQVLDALNYRSSSHALGPVEHFQRSRIVSCGGSDSPCNPEWIPWMEPHYYKSNRLHAILEAPKVNTPYLLFLSGYDYSGTQLMPKVQCRFATEKDFHAIAPSEKFNVVCEILDSSLSNPAQGLLAYSDDSEKKMFGMLTTSCLRLKASYYVRKPIVLTDRIIEDIRIVENLIFVNF